MLAIFKKRWVWITAIFLVINIAGLLKIISLLEDKRGYPKRARPSIIRTIDKKIRQVLWPVKKAAKDIAKETKVQEDFRVHSISPEMYGTTPHINIEVFQKVDLNQIKGYIAITPEVDFYTETYYYGIRLCGDFQPGKSYMVEILKGMPSAKGVILKETEIGAVTIPDYDPAFKFKVPGMYMSLKGSQAIPVEAVNVDKLKVKIHKVYDNNIVYLLNNMSSYSFPSDLGLDVVEKEIKTEGKRNEKKEVLIDLRELLSSDSHGLFFMTLNKPDAYYWNRESKLILTTDIGIVAKRADSELLVWLNSLSTTSAVSGATVKVFTKTNQQVLQGLSDENGLAHFKDIDWSGDRKPFVITASHEEDLSFIEVEKCTLSETAFDIEGRPYLSADYEGFLYTDRGIYRPGETIHLRAILRGVGCEVPKSFPVVFDIERPDGRRFKKLNGVLSRFGTVDVDVDIEDYALTGGYTANLMLPGSKEKIGSCKFNVEEFMPDRLKVDIDIPDKRFKVAETMPIVVKAEHFFGAAASGRQVEVTCNLRPVDFEPEGYKDYVFTDETKEFSKRTLRLGEKASDDKGKANFELKLPEGITPPSALNASISATVKELGGRAVSSYSAREVDAYPYYVGVRQTTEGYASADQEIGFDYVALSPSGEKIVVMDLEVSVGKISWNYVLKKDENGRYRYISESSEECIFEDTITSKDGSGTFMFTPKAWGRYIVRIKGKGKGMHGAGVEFYCSGDGYMPWAMERPDRIELELDKTHYLPGDEARLVIKSPFKGKALLTISKDKVLLVKSIELATPTQEIPIAVDESFAPNAYCAVSVIRPVVPEEEWVAHRAYGIIPIALDNSEHQLRVKVTAPDSVQPEDIVKLTLNVEASDGSSGEAELSVALVDEGVLRLTGFKTPDAFDFFYGKRASNVVTCDYYSLLIPEFGKKKIGADSVPSGDEAFEPKKHLMPISAKRVKPVVLWKSNIVTNEQGRANVEFKIPEFAGNLRIMVVAASGKDFGNAQDDIKIVEPLMIRPTLPRCLSVNDEFILPVTIFNTTGKDGEVAVSLAMSAGFELLSEKVLSINVKDKSEGMGIFKLKAPSLPQKAYITVKALMDGYSISRTTELPVRPPAPFTTISGSGAVKGSKDTIISIPGGWLKGTEKFTLSVMPFPGLQFAGGLKFLARYPYGCIEQTTSCVFPLLYLHDIAALVEPEKFSPDSIDAYIDAGIQKILSMQTYSGGFAFWPGYSETYDWGSIYATDFLVEADKAGYAVPKFEKDVALDYLERMLSDKKDRYPSGLKAYSCFVLAKAGRLKPSWIRRLQELKEKMSADSKFHLAAALAFLGDEEAVADILGQGLADTPVERETGGSLKSYARENSIALSVYMDIDPENEMVPILVKRLESSMKGGNWPTTQDNAMALLALGKYARFVEGQDTDYSGTLSVGRELIAEFDDEQGAEIRDIALGGKEIKLSIQGKGTAYYYWSAEGVPIKGKLEEKDKGIKVRRSFLTREGKPLDVNKITQGEVIVVDISLDAERAYQNVIIADLLPACFEIENPRISTRETVEWIGKDIFDPDHIDIRDDRLLLFTDLPEKGELHYRYIVRAVTKGEFVLPPISATCMYDPSILSVHGQGKTRVK